MTVDCSVNVIVPVYNGARYLGEALESVLAQTCPVEAIVVDDGSTDDSAAVAGRFGDRVLIVQQPHLGQAAALNAGIARATRKYVAFLDADDLWLPEKAARQVARFDARLDLDYCVTRIQGFVSPELESTQADIDPSLLQAAPGYLVSALMARRSLFEELGGFDTGLRHANKTAWFLAARNAGAVGEELNDVLVRRRLHAANTSQMQAGNSLDEYLWLIKRSLDRRRAGPG